MSTTDFSRLFCWLLEIMNKLDVVVDEEYRVFMLTLACFCLAFGTLFMFLGWAFGFSLWVGLIPIIAGVALMIADALHF